MGSSGIHVQLIPITHRFRGCELANLLKCICNPKINTHSSLAIIWGHAQSTVKSEWPHTCSQLRSGGRGSDALPLVSALVLFTSVLSWSVECHGGFAHVCALCW